MVGGERRQRRRDLPIAHIHLLCEEVANEVFCFRHWCSNTVLLTGGVVDHTPFFSSTCDLKSSFAVSASKLGTSILGRANEPRQNSPCDGATAL